MWTRLIELQINADDWVFSPPFEADFVRLAYPQAKNVSGIVIAQSFDTYPIPLFNLRSLSVKLASERDVIQLSPTPFELPCLVFKAIPAVRLRGYTSLSVVLEVGNLSMPLSNPATIQAPVSTLATSSTIAAAVASTVLLAANAARKGATIYNNSTATLYIDLDNAVTTAAYTAQLAPGGYYEVPYNFTGDISGIWSAANGNALVRELT